MLKLSDPVIYVDPVGVARGAIVTAIWGGDVKAKDGQGNAIEIGNGQAMPCINVAFLSGDENRRDTYGRQIERSTSVVHMHGQTAHGNYWRRVDEPGKDTEQ